MEIRLRVEKVQNGIIFTDEKMERFVDTEPKLAINQVIDRVISAIDTIGDVMITIETLDREPVGNKKGY